MKNKQKKLITAFGLNDFGFVDLPTKLSGTTYQRVLIGDKYGNSFDFPHGRQSLSSRHTKCYKNWKYNRKNQYR